MTRRAARLALVVVCLSVWQAGPSHAAVQGDGPGRGQDSQAGTSAIPQAPPLPRVPGRPVPKAMLEGPHLVVDPRDAVVGVRVENTSSDGVPGPTRVGNGLILRCDGFVLIPTALLELSRTSKSEYADNQRVTVYLHPGTDREKAVLCHPRRIGGARRDPGYLVVKLPGVHVPAVRTLLLDGAKAGDELRVLASAYDARAKRFARPEGHAASLGDAASLQNAAAPGAAPLSDAPDNLPAGAAVIGPDNMAVGLLEAARAGKPQTFRSFELLADATNCTVAAPVSDELFARRTGKQTQDGSAEPEAGSAPDGMVRVPAGPVWLPDAVAAEQQEMLGEKLACVPEFLIDKYEVTNEQYLAFWRSLDEKTRGSAAARRVLYPAFWSPNESDPFAANLGSIPVMGVTYAGASAYARWCGKRLPTPYEWCRAAFGQEGEQLLPRWVGDYVADRLAASTRAVAAHWEYARANRSIIISDIVDRPSIEAPGASGGWPGWFWKLPWTVYHGRSLAISEFSKSVVEQATETLFGKWLNPHQVSAAGSRSFDVSPCGAADMLLNADELVVPWPGAPASPYGRYMHIEWTTAGRGHLGRPGWKYDTSTGDPAVFWDVETSGKLVTGGDFGVGVAHWSAGSLDRLYRVDPSPSLVPLNDAQVNMAFSLMEVRSMLEPVVGLRTMLGNARAVALKSLGPWSGESAKLARSHGWSLDGRDGGYGLWQHPPRHSEPTMGRRPIVSGPDPSLPFEPFDFGFETAPVGPKLFCYLPVGFRCAR